MLIGGGAGGGKTLFGSAWVTMMANSLPRTRWFIGRNELKRLKQSTLLTFLEQLRDWDFVQNRDFHYNRQEGVITFLKRQSEIYLLDVSYMPSDPNYDRFGSTEYTGGFIDEVEEITSKAREVLKTRIRYKLEEHDLIPKLLLSCIPSKNWVYVDFYKPWRDGNLPKDRAFVRILVTDNPHASPQYIASLKKIRDRVLRERLLEGNWEYEDSDLSLFHFDQINDLFTNVPVDSDQFYLTCDVARFGADKTVIMIWKGFMVINIKVILKSDLTAVERAIMQLAEQYKIRISHVLVDEDGVGGGVVDHLKCKGFVGGASALERHDQTVKETEFKVNYQNMRAQCYYTLSEYVNDAKIGIRTEDLTYRDLIIEELEQIRTKDSEKEQRLKIIPKEEIKLNLGRSPDFADALMMRMYFEVHSKGATIRFSDIGFI